MSTQNTCGSREFVDVVVACTFTIDTCFDAITLILDLRKSKINFGGDASDIETADI